MSLVKRPRFRRVVADISHRALHAVGASGLPTTGDVASAEPAVNEVAPPQAASPGDFARERGVGLLALEAETATSRLFATLNSEDVVEVERRIAGEPAAQEAYEAAPDEATRRFLVLAYGIWLGVPAIAEKTGLSPSQPPEDVHAMARGPYAAAGGLYESDLVVDALRSVGVDMAELRDALDFGCSSARVLRVLSVAYPEVGWRGCDPNEPAIEWASENLPGIEFFVSADEPPLPLADASLDLAYAISIWSHFEPGLGVRWFEEMHRLIRPGGHLVCTTHGLTSVAYYALGDMRTPEQSREIADALYSRGWWYAAEFGEEGDWGVVNPSWGTAFLSPEWMLTQLCPHWRVLEFAAGRNQYNQDVYVLERV
jgi:SAM-dependent methyltransferase